MKRAINFSLLFYVALVVAIFFVGRNIIADANAFIDEPMMFFIISIALGFVFNVVLFELGHMFGAKLGGYKTYSVSFLGVTIYKVKGKWQIGYDGTYDGFTGETKIVPHKEKTNPSLYFWMGSLLLVIEMVVTICLPSLITLSPQLKYGAYIFAVIAGIILIYNIVPFRLDSTNDATLMKYVTKDKVDVFNKVCSIRYDLYLGNQIKEVEILEDVDYVSARINYYAYLEAIYKKDYEKAEAIIDSLIEQSEKLSEDIFLELLPAKMYILTMTKTKEEVEKYFASLPANDRKLLNSCVSIEGCRNYFAFVALIIEDYDDAKNIYRKYVSKKDKLKEVGRLFDEESLISELMAKIKELHPEWDFTKTDL